MIGRHEDSGRGASNGAMVFFLCALMALACNYRTDLLSDNPTGGIGGAPETEASASAAEAGAGGATSNRGTTATGGTTSTGGSTNAGLACTRDDECDKCVYSTAPTTLAQCEGALACCGGPVMNKATCAKNQAAWESNCANRGYTVPLCPCIACGLDSRAECHDGRCRWLCP